MDKHPEIQALEKLCQDHRMQIQVIGKNILFEALEHVWVDFTINRETFTLIVDDEYKDFQIDNPLLHLCLVLRELETYHEEEDILEWTKHKYLDAGNSKVLTYYRSLSEIYARIEGLLGKINSHISYFDFELNAGAAQELRLKK